MSPSESSLNRLGVITALAKRVPGDLGRTALMKLLYFLKTLKGLPLDYDFRLYTYGPFDSNVLDDLQYAGSLGAINSMLQVYPGGYGYIITLGEKSEELINKVKKFIEKYEDDIDWVVNEFGMFSATDLELLSTIIYVDREAKKNKQKLRIDVLTMQVHEIKPKFSDGYIKDKIGYLDTKKLLQSLNS